MNEDQYMQELYQQAEILEAQGEHVSSDTTTVVNPECPSLQMVSTNPGWPRTATTKENVTTGLIADLRASYAHSLRENRYHG